MLGFNPGIYFLDIRVKPEYDREEAEDDIKEAALKRDNSSSVIPGFLFFPVIAVFFSFPLSLPDFFSLSYSGLTRISRDPRIALRLPGDDLEGEYPGMT